MHGYKLVLTVAAALLIQQSAASGAPVRIGSTTATKNQVAGLVEGNKLTLTTGSDIYSNELISTGSASIGEFVFVDSTKLSVGPISEVRLDKFVYNSAGSNSRVVLKLAHGAFRFVTGALDKRAYTIETAYGTIGVRGTILEIALMPCVRQLHCGLIVHLVDGGAFVRTLRGQVVNLSQPNTMVTVSPDGAVRGPISAPTSILNFASLDGTMTAGLNLPVFLAGLVLTGALVPILHHEDHTLFVSPN